MARRKQIQASTSGAPTTGTWKIGDFTIDQAGAVWICITAGSPGTWTRANSAQARLSKHYRCR